MRYITLKSFTDDVELIYVKLLLITEREYNNVDQLFTQLHDLNSITPALQEGETALRSAPKLFEGVIANFRRLKN